MKVLLFRHSNICNDSLNAFTDYIADEFSKRGVEHEFFDVTRDPELMQNELYRIIDDGFDAVLTFNDPDIHNTLTPEGRSLFDKYGVQFYNWIVDHPMSQMHYLDSCCMNYNILCLDRQHVKFVNNYRPGIRSVSFLPLGGIPLDKSIMNPISDREYDISFPGGLSADTLKDAFDSYKRMESPNKDIILNLIDHMLEDRRLDPDIALSIVLKDLFGTDRLDDNEYRKALQLANTANNFMRNYNREEVLRCLIDTELSLHIFGNGWRERIGTGSGHTMFHTSLSYQKTGEVFKRSKILLNVMPCFKDGTHDRIASAMLHNALAMTDRSRYLDELPRGTMGFYDIDNINELPDILRELLDNSEKIQNIADCGYEYANEHFTWEKTVDKLLEIMNSTGQ